MRIEQQGRAHPIHGPCQLNERPRLYLQGFSTSLQTVLDRFIAQSCRRHGGESRDNGAYADQSSITFVDLAILSFCQGEDDICFEKQLIYYGPVLLISVTFQTVRFSPMKQIVKKWADFPYDLQNDRFSGGNHPNRNPTKSS